MKEAAAQRSAMMKKKAKKAKKTTKGNKKRAANKSRVSAKAKVSAKSRKKKSASRRQPVAPRARVRESQDVMENEGIRKVPLSAASRPKARSSRVGGGGGDFTGISVVEGADSESPKELLDEGQAFESGIVGAVQNAPNADEGEVRTREVPMDDVPTEYDDQDRPINK
jgi:hypothetical protein